MGSFSLRAEALLIVGGLLVLCLDCAPALGGEVLFQGSVAVSEEYNDNVTMARSGARSDFITNFTPAVDLGYTTGYSDLRLHASMTYENFARGALGDRLYPDVSTTDNLSLLGRFLYLNVSDVYRRVPLNYGYENLLTNQADQNFLTLKPYLYFPLTSRTTLTTGYVYQSVVYNGRNAIDWQEHGGFAKLSHQLTQNLGTFVDLSYARTFTSDGVRSTRMTPSFGIDCNYGDNSRVYLAGGYTFLHVDGGSSSSDPYWKAGINHSFGTVTAALKGEVSYNTDPQRSLTVENKVEGALTKEMPRARVAITPFYSSIKDTVSNSSAKERYGATLNAGYDLSSKARVTAAVTGEKDRGTLAIRTAANPQAEDQWGKYLKVTADAELSYALLHDLRLYVSYNYSTWLFDAVEIGSIRQNRMIIGVTKTFDGHGFKPASEMK